MTTDDPHADDPDSSVPNSSVPNSSVPNSSVPNSSDPAVEPVAVTDARNHRLAVRAGLAVGVATATYGVSFGALSVAAGLSIWQTSFMSLVMFSGGSQFALIGVLAAGGLTSGPAAIASASLLGVRNSLYGMRTAPVVAGGRWNDSWVKRIAAGWLTIDESTAVALAQPTPTSRRTGFWVTGLAVFIGWNITTLAGALIGDALGDTRAYGLDAAAAAAFVGLLWPRLKRRQAVAVAVAAAVVAALLTPVLVPGVPVLVAALVAVLVGFFNWFGPRESGAGLVPGERMPS